MSVHLDASGVYCARFLQGRPAPSQKASTTGQSRLAVGTCCILPRTRHALSCRRRRRPRPWKGPCPWSHRLALPSLTLVRDSAKQTWPIAQPRRRASLAIWIRASASGRCWTSSGSSEWDSSCWSHSPGFSACCPARSSSSNVQAVTYRRDRFGESWHLIPAGELGRHGRSLCGEPRQGTRLSESYADVRPGPPETLCPRCIEAHAAASMRSTAHV